MADTTLTMPSSERPDASAAVLRLYPALIVVAHPNPAALGERLVFAEDGDEVTLGRGGTAFAAGVLDDPMMSREHLALTRCGDTLQLRDLGSRNGGYLNGERFEQLRASPGDVVRIGSLALLFERCVRARVTPLQSRMVARSAAMVQLCRQLHLAAQSDVTVLIQGATGSGKEVAAREIHLKSGRDGRFVAVNCAALMPSLMLSELYGHAKGAFSGAEQARDGLVEGARAGTLFFDEVGDASAALQSALLRLLEQREFRRVGEQQLRSSDARFVSASHVALARAAAAGQFRQDLLGRLNRWSVAMPPLAERREDIVPLALRFAAERRNEPWLLSPALVTALLRHPWPGNVRELAAVIDQAVISAAGDLKLELSAELAARLEASASAIAPELAVHDAVTARSTDAQQARPQSLAELGKVVAAAGGNMRAAAQRLGVSRATVYRWLDELGGSSAELRRIVQEQRSGA